MTDKNRDFSQIRVGTVVAFPQTTVAVTAAKGYLVIARGQERFTFSSDTGAVINLNQVWWERTGAYIVSQPEEQAVADWDVCPDCVGFGVNNKLFVCATCNGTGGVWESEETGHIQCPTCADQASLRTREEHIDALALLLLGMTTFAPEKANPKIVKESSTRHITEAEKRGDAAGYARRVAEEGGEAVAWGYVNPESTQYLRDHANVTTLVTKKPSRRCVMPLYTKPQPDTRDETIAEQAATIATLREYFDANEAIRKIGLREAGPALFDRCDLAHAAVRALAATGEK